MDKKLSTSQSRTKTKENERFVTLSPMQQTLKVDGKLFYNEPSQAWSIIRLKKEMLQEFPQLKEKRDNFIYQMYLPRKYEDLKKMLNEMEKQKQTIPILMFLCKRMG